MRKEKRHFWWATDHVYLTLCSCGHQMTASLPPLTGNPKENDPKLLLLSHQGQRAGLLDFMPFSFHEVWMNLFMAQNV